MSKDAAPTPGDLAAIADEWPVIEAELAVVMAECRLAASPDEVAVRAHCRAVAALENVTRRSAPSRVKVRRLVAVGARRVADVGTASAAA
jgi:hypothetical protein